MIHFAFTCTCKNMCIHDSFSVIQSKYKQIAEMDRASYTTVIDTPDIIHAQQMRNIVSQVGDL